MDPPLSTFNHHYDQISVAQPITAIPPVREQDDFTLVMSPVKWVFRRFSFGFHHTSLKESVFSSELIILIVLPIDLLNLSAGQYPIVNAHIVNVTIE